jgi:hypothetical protein
VCVSRSPLEMLKLIIINIVVFATGAAALSQSIPGGISRHYGGAGFSPTTPQPLDANAVSHSVTELRIPAFLARHYAGKGSFSPNSSGSIAALGPIVDAVAPNDWILQAKPTATPRTSAPHASTPRAP